MYKKIILTLMLLILFIKSNSFSFDIPDNYFVIDKTAFSLNYAFNNKEIFNNHLSEYLNESNDLTKCITVLGDYAKDVYMNDVNISDLIIEIWITDEMIYYTQN